MLTLEMADVSCDIILTRDQVFYSTIRSLDIIGSQITSAIDLIPVATFEEKQEVTDLCCNLRRILGLAVKNLDILKTVFSDEGDGLKPLRVRQEDLMQTKWKRLGEGHFSNVFEAKLRGNTVAVKVLKDFKHSRALFTEGNLLKDFRHDNIVAFRGMDTLEDDMPEYQLKKSSPFIVMEYISNNLYKYVESQRTAEEMGLSTGLVWNLTKQIANGLYYLHGLMPPVSHCDLKPDNLLLDNRSMRVKIADFGLSRPIIPTNEGTISLVNVRWSAPELWFNDKENKQSSRSEVEKHLLADIYSFGQVAAYLLTGDAPWRNCNTSSVYNMRKNAMKRESKITIPEKLKGPLREIIETCRQKEPEKRPTSSDLVKKYFSDDSNPYQSEAESAQFFSCGFLDDTKIFVVDSLINNDKSSIGYIKTNEIPKGYPRQCLICEVHIDNDDNEEYNDDIPAGWIYEETYRKHYEHFILAAEKKKIVDNPAIALKSVATPREGEDERQELLLKFGETTYCHHRAMREIWMKELDESKRAEFVPSKNVVNSIFSTSFGLHVAVLTDDSPPKFIFAQRANREGMATPGKFTCGAVESASIIDYMTKPGDTKTYVDLLKTAARGLDEELLVTLEGNDVEAICLSTIYLKYDTHEWGLCGFVNMADERIDPSRRLTYSMLRDRFTLAPKDKFENEELKAVDFTLPTMVEFVRENYHNFASSAKLVVVKVLQSHFGIPAVEQAFMAYADPPASE